MIAKINNEISENLTDRKKYNKVLNISNNNDSHNSYTKDIKNKKNSYIGTDQSKKIYSFKSKILLFKKKSQNKQNNEDKNYNITSSKYYFHKKTLSNINGFYDNPIKKHTYDILKRNIYNYYYRNNQNKELVIKKYCKSNNNK